MLSIDNRGPKSKQADEKKSRLSTPFAIDPQSILPPKSSLKQQLKLAEMHNNTIEQRFEEYQTELAKILDLRKKTNTLWDTLKYCTEESDFQRKYTSEEIQYFDNKLLLTEPDGYKRPDTFEYKQLSEELTIIDTEFKAQPQEIKSDDQTIDSANYFTQEREKVEDRLFVLDKEKQKSDAEEETCCKSWFTLNNVDTVIDPIFQFSINIYSIARNLIRDLSDAADRTISYISFGFGKFLNFLNLYSLYRDVTTPQRKTKIVSTIINIFAAIANTTVTAIRTNPYAQTIIGLSTTTLSLYKDSYCTHQMRMTIQDEEKEIKKLEKKLEVLKNMTSLDRADQLQLKRLPIQIKYRKSALEYKINNALFEQFRGVFFTTLNAVCGLFLLAGALGTTLFPPLWIPVLTSLATTCAFIQSVATFFDMADQFTHKIPYFQFTQYQFSRWLAYDLPNHIINSGKRAFQLPLRLLGYASEAIELEKSAKIPGYSQASISLVLSSKSGKPIDFQTQASSISADKTDGKTVPAQEPIVTLNPPEELNVQSRRCSFG